ncbi:sedoheptulose 7-phosphate cyclase [Pseudomonas aeruginosa]|uniref:sedoheptulose 7-phosphate cyclase n=1 Tax=Pseudomonas aeruginosa TaxID=287 RepID=UPI0031D6E2D1
MEIMANDSLGSDECLTWRIRGELKLQYDVIEAPNLLDVDSRILEDIGREDMQKERRSLLVADRQVFKLHGDNITRYFIGRGIKFQLTVIDTSESTKNLDTVRSILNSMIEFGIARRCEPVIVFGGGCLMDLVGLAAGLYRRKVPYVRVPTTLLGIVDAAIGVKTGCNFGEHKNRIGSYYPPVAALLNRSFLRTLPDRHIRNGLAEILKMGIVADEQLFALLETHCEALVQERLAESRPAAEVIRLAVQSMLVQLEPNLWETDLRRIVDFGHGFSPIFEMKALDELLHGEAVAVDMCICTVIAANRKLLAWPMAMRILELVVRMGLPVTHPTCTAENFRDALLDASRHRGGRQSIPVPSAIGRAVFLDDIGVAECLSACAFIESFVGRGEDIAASGAGR